MNIENHKIEYFFLQNCENSKYGRVMHHFYTFHLHLSLVRIIEILSQIIISSKFHFFSLSFTQNFLNFYFISTKLLTKLTKLTKLINIDIFINPHTWRHFSWLVQIRVQRPLQYKRLQDRSAKRLRRRIAKSISIIGV